MIYAYARVSSSEQNLDRQLEEFKNYNIDKIYAEKKSGKNFQDRDEYQKLRKKLKPNDLLIIMSIDRLGRNYEEILNEWKYITNDKKCDIQVLDMPILNTKNSVEGLDGKFISNLALQILAYVSQKEREKIKERQMQGIKIARQKGVKFGRPKIEIDECIFKIDCKTHSNEWMMNEYEISRGTFFKLKNKLCPELMYKNQEKIMAIKPKKRVIAYLKDNTIIETSTIKGLSNKLYVSDTTIRNFMNGKQTTILDNVQRIEIIDR